MFGERGLGRSRDAWTFLVMGDHWRYPSTRVHAMSDQDERQGDQVEKAQKSGREQTPAESQGQAQTEGQEKDEG